MRFDLPRFASPRSTPTRPGTPALALGLMLPLVATMSAAAQSRPTWVDPPARTEPAAPAARPPEPVKPETPKAEAPASEPTRSEARAPDASPRQAADEGGAMAGPSRRADRPRMRRRAARRLADAPPAEGLRIAPRVPAQGQAQAEGAAADPRFSGWAGRAEDLAGDYLAAFSGSDGAMVGGAGRFYGERLRFHGRTMTRDALVAEKRRFARRWPERRYEPRSSRTACNAALETCVVHTIVDFRAASPARGARSQGIAELVLEVRFAGGRPVIVSESSRVLRRGATAGALAAPAANG